MAKKLTLTNTIGALGEDIAVLFLVKHGFSIEHRNYLKKWGEIDIVARKGAVLHFVEVKSVSCERMSHETCGINPAELVHAKKRARIERVIQSYLGEYGHMGMWEVRVLAVHINIPKRTAFVAQIEL